MERRRCRGITLVETLVGAIVLAVCAAPLMGSVAWIRGRAADATVDAQVAIALTEQMALVRSLGRTTALTAGTVTSSRSLGGGVTLAVVRTVAPLSGSPRLYDVTATGTWTSRGEGGQARTMTLETYAFSPDN